MMNQVRFDSVLTGVALALLLAGCTTMIPNHERPAAPVAAAYPGATAGRSRPARRRATSNGNTISATSGCSD